VKSESAKNLFQKRTLREIYKILKRDVKNTMSSTSNLKIPQQLPASSASFL
jgi:hypothetical protein